MKPTRHMDNSQMAPRGWRRTCPGAIGRALAGACVAVLLLGLTTRAGDRVPPQDLDTVLKAAREFVRSQQLPTGAFGSEQPHLQTSVAVLALLAMETSPAEQDLTRIHNAVTFLVRTSSPTGDLPDETFGTESHALSLTAILCALPTLPDGETRQKAGVLAYRALRRLQRWQDRSSSSPSRGGWKMAGTTGRDNDRRASAWALLAYLTAEQYGLEVKAANRERGLGFLQGSLKTAADNVDQLGGFSVDTEGLAVASVSAMGGWFLQRWRPDTSEASQNVAWLTRHPSTWSGPNYFYTEFFRLRALAFADPAGDAFQDAFRRAFLQIREHQAGNGGVGFPPGNAQNTVAMGPGFSTSMSILVLSAGNSRLVFDEDYRVRPSF